MRKWCRAARSGTRGWTFGGSEAHGRLVSARSLEMRPVTTMGGQARPLCKHRGQSGSGEADLLM